MPRIVRDIQLLVNDDDDHLYGYRLSDGTEVRIGSSQPENAAAVVGAAGVAITESALLTTTGNPDTLYKVSDGDNRGAKLVWAVPEGESVATWCWWLWPQASYF